MKKVFALFLTLCLLLVMVTSVIAEDKFSLRCNIHFGDTMDEVKAKETLGFDKETEDTLETSKGILGGVDGSYIRYCFKDGKLTEALWFLNAGSYGSYSQDVVKNDYSKIHDALIQKYGSPLGYTNGDCHIITGGGIDGVANLTYLSQALGGGGDVLDYDEWIVNSEGTEKVKIDMAFGYYYYDSILNKKYVFQLSYKAFTEEDVNNALQEKEDANSAILNDI